MKCTKAIIPVAGYGTRRLPITKSIEKCMLPVLNRPVIDYVVQDCIKAGITDIYFVIGKGTSQLKSFYAQNKVLEDYLVANKKEAAIAMITPPTDVTFHYVEQDTADDRRYGTTIPVWLCRQYVEPDEQVLVIMGDQFLYRLDGGSEAADLIAETEAAGCTSSLLGVPVPKEEIPKYGIIDKDDQDHYIKIVEKPTIEEAPSNLNNASFYLFDHEIFRFLDQSVQAGPSDSGEYLITDAVNDYVNSGKAMHVAAAKGTYLDCGSEKSWLVANNFVAEHPVEQY
ncbi:MAG TPA: sugar phosphate nucleotidyltransferase [Candidatus Saccharimonadales bacterium]|jgi:UTP--glucose-1-phosphate uridylyltransferase|nr:sugar phosphate nucleotidyltransferase [Candidatus Saccharimonadales bacterium]